MMSQFENNAVVESSTPRAFFWKDHKGVFKGWNQHFLVFSQLLNNDGLCEKNDKQLPWADRWEDYWRDDQYVINTAETITRVEKVTIATKEIIAQTVKTQWIQNGKIAGVLGVIHDITQQVKTKTIITDENCSADYCYNAISENKILELTSREFQCISLWIAGNSAKKIGQILGISSRTVEVHMDRIRLKNNIISKDDVINRLHVMDLYLNIIVYAESLRKKFQDSRR